MCKISNETIIRQTLDARQKPFVHNEAGYHFQLTPGGRISSMRASLVPHEDMIEACFVFPIMVHKSEWPAIQEKLNVLNDALLFGRFDIHPVFEEIHLRAAISTQDDPKGLKYAARVLLLYGVRVFNVVSEGILRMLCSGEEVPLSSTADALRGMEDWCPDCCEAKLLPLKLPDNLLMDDEVTEIHSIEA